MLVVEHDMDFVRGIARTVTVMHEGRVLAEGPMQADGTTLRSSRYISELKNAADPRAESVLRREPHALGY